MCLCQFAAAQRICAWAWCGDASYILKAFSAPVRKIRDIKLQIYINFSCIMSQGC
jgi:hypothetical protein